MPLFLALMTGCATFAIPGGPPVALDRTGPEIVFAKAEAQSGWGGPTWMLEADVLPGDAPLVFVGMDVYDEACCDERVLTIELFEEEEGAYELRWTGSAEVLDPWYEHYTFDVIAEDRSGRTDLVTIWPDTL